MRIPINWKRLFAKPVDDAVTGAIDKLGDKIGDKGREELRETLVASVAEIEKAFPAVIDLAVGREVRVAYKIEGAVTVKIEENGVDGVPGLTS